MEVRGKGEKRAGYRAWSLQPQSRSEVTTK